MNIIAIETSGRRGSLAALEADRGETRLIEQTVLGDEQRTAQALAPALRDLLASVGWSPQAIELVAVAVGPGSFTGLRIGVTTAKTLAYAVGAQAIGVNTLRVLATQAPQSGGALWTILDAQREELFVARFNVDMCNNASTECDTSIISIESWLKELKPGERVVGPPLRRLAARLPSYAEAAPEACWQPMAAALGAVAWRAFEAGHRNDVWKLAPNYYRTSYAEEKAAKSEMRGARP